MSAMIQAMCKTREAPAARWNEPPHARLRRRLAALCMLFVCLALPMQHGRAASGTTAAAGVAQQCPGGSATVEGGTPKDLETICAGVDAAIGFFARFDIRPTEPLSIEVAAKIPAEAGPTASGCFIEAKRRIYVVPYDQFRRNATWFGVKIDREMYRALAAHESAHAIAACNFAIPNPTIQAKEYLAYVAMLSTMPAPLRDKAIRGARAVGFQSFERFTPLLYMFDPMRFGAEAYQHFKRLDDPGQAVRSILAGDELLD